VTLYHRFTSHINAALDALIIAGALPAGLDRRSVAVEPPRDPAHGDLATNAAMVLAKPAGTNPRVLAELLAAELRQISEVSEVSIAGPGFINLRLADPVWHEELRAILTAGPAYGRSSIGDGTTVNVEFVSANPTGPMHMGHCRGAVVGDALANLLEVAGHTVIREYYVNDAGAQVDVLARSAHIRYREALGEVVSVPEGLYPGEYLIAVGTALAAEHGARYQHAPEADWLALFRTTAVAMMLDRIRADLAALGIVHDVFASEAEVQTSGKAAAAVAALTAKGLIYQGKLDPPKGELPDDWEPVELTLFRASQYGDDSDRPVKKSDGRYTYFGSDLAYHAQKAETAAQLINIWGADHAGTVKRIKAAISALTDNRVTLDVVLIQMVRLLRNGEPVKMSKRSGNFVTLAEVVEEVGKDVVRFTMLTRRADAQMDFDFAKVVEASKDNPVFYVQYAYARIRSLFRKLGESGTERPAIVALDRLDSEELALVKWLAQYPRMIEQAAANREPHRIAFYLYELAAMFHALWNRGNDDPERRIIMVNAPETMYARLALAEAIGVIINNGLTIIGVTAAEEM
jgi:arginyl-tRNA synthetase